MTSANPFAAAGTGNGFASFLLGYGTGGGVNQNALGRRSDHLPRLLRRRPVAGHSDA